MGRFGLMDIQEREKRLKILIKELHPTKNKDLDVSSLKSGSGKKLWWKCHKGHIWETRISNRVYHSSGCPKCKKGKVFKHPLIVDVKPELLDELHPEKNKDIDFIEAWTRDDKWVLDRYKAIGFTKFHSYWHIYFKGDHTKSLFESKDKDIKPQSVFAHSDKDPKTLDQNKIDRFYKCSGYKLKLTK